MGLIERAMNHFGVNGELILGDTHKVLPDFMLYDIQADGERYALCRADYMYNDDEVVNAIKQTLNVAKIVIVEPVDGRVVDKEAGNMSFAKIDTGDAMNTFALAVIK